MKRITGFCVSNYSMCLDTRMCQVIGQELARKQTALWNSLSLWSYFFKIYLVFKITDVILVKGSYLNSTFNRHLY